MLGHKTELEEAVRKGNEKFNSMITEQLMAQEDVRRSAEAETKVIYDILYIIYDL